MEHKTMSNFFNLPSERELRDKIERRDDLRELFETWSSGQQQEYLDRCTGNKGHNLLYDAYFKEVMNPEYDPSRLESFLEIALGEPVKILKQLPNDGVRLEDEGTLLVTDIVVELLDSSIANVEVQKIGYMFTGPRCSCYLSDMMLRQYKRIRAREKKAFSYGKIKKVYLIVLYETSPVELRQITGAYLHRARHVFDTGLEMDLLQRCTLISLDIFKKNMQNKAISTLQEAWLTFLSESDPKRLVELFEAYPQFIAMYETLYSMDKDMVRTMGFFSEELRIMDRNTVRYMIDEMEGTIKRLESKKEELEAQKSQLETQNGKLEAENDKLEAENDKLEAENDKLEAENDKLEAENDKLEVKNSQLEAENDKLRAELQKYRNMKQ